DIFNENIFLKGGSPRQREQRPICKRMFLPNSRKKEPARPVLCGTKGICNMIHLKINGIYQTNHFSTMMLKMAVPKAD
ncbi:hypothetical protein, partial [Desulfovibrio piger]|uniref:hypothetical protein n=1 Tax=Desulfovibrio piger TaxID=901 RepID=UPI0026EFF68E